MADFTLFTLLAIVVYWARDSPNVLFITHCLAILVIVFYLSLISRLLLVGPPVSNLFLELIAFGKSSSKSILNCSSYFTLGW
jgi:hypothetical protein